jgi:hypothetical protein
MKNKETPAERAERIAKEREKNIRKDDFDKQKPFSTSPIGGHIKRKK